jgi:hypothetical protein
MARRVGFVGALLVAGSAGHASAQDGAEPTPAELRAAAEAFDRGREAYKAQRYTEAAEQFERADGSAPSATALALAIRSRDNAGDLDRAGTLAALALERYPDDADIQKIAPELIARARADLYEITVMCAEPCELADGTKIVHGAAARQRTLFLTAGSHSLRAGFPDGRTESQDVDATPGTNGTVTFEARVSEPEPEAPDAARAPSAPAPEAPLEAEAPKSSGLSPVVFYVAAGATVALAGVTAWSGLDTVKNPGEERVRAECAQNDVECPLYKQGVAKQRRTNVLIGVTAGLGVATGVLAAIGIDWSGGGPKPPTDEARGPGFSFEPGVALGDGAVLFARGRF